MSPVIRDQSRLESIDQALEFLQVPNIQRIRGTERQPDPMETQRIVLANLLQIKQRRTAGAKIILAVHLYPSNTGQQGQYILVMRGPKADPGACRDRIGVSLCCM